MDKKEFDIVVVGGGIVGLSTARELLLRNPAKSIALIEKESELARHQSGHNSGVIHAGIYYKPGSLKAKLCVEGHAAALNYLEEKNIPYRLCGKLIVALNESELDHLDDLYERGKQNGVGGLTMLEGEQIREIEPHVAGIRAIYSPNTGVVDWRQVALAYADDIREYGGHILTNCALLHTKTHGSSTILVTTLGDIQTETVITCTGLYSDRISGEQKQVRIVPFRGSYYTLSEKTQSMVNGLIYPVPDPQFPFLGVHFTRTMSDEVWVGPNAVLAFAREGYNRWDFNLRDLAETLSFSGFWQLAHKYWRMGSLEMYRDYVKRAYLATAQSYIPDLQMVDLLPGPSGVRAQALRNDGTLVDDFLIQKRGHVIHVQNAPSPAATSSLMIGAAIADQIYDVSP